jgi:hypothetical protein
MTVPTHNLYDFVHQATKKRYILLYHYPFGSRDLHNVCSHQPNIEHINGELGIDKKYLLASQLNSTDQIDCSYVHKTQPILFCHDQEPLNFDLYLDDADYVKHYKQTLAKSSKFDPRNICFNNFNLRWTQHGNIQKSWTLLHSELNSNNLTRYESTGRFVGAYWWSHAVIARDWYRFAEHDTSLVPTLNPKKLFLVYCRDVTGSRAYRQKFLCYLENQSLSADCQIQSFNKVEATSDSSAVYNREDHISTGISVVLETVFDERIHLTEKTLRPIACGHPFILAAGPGSLALLRRYGFRTFTGYINEYYDDIKDPSQRLAAICQEMKRIQQLPKKEQQKLLKACQDIAVYNRKHFFSTNFLDEVNCELQSNITAAFNSHLGEIDLELWWNTTQWYKKNGFGHILTKPYKKVFLPLYRKFRRLAANKNSVPPVV